MCSSPSNRIGNAVRGAANGGGIEGAGQGFQDDRDPNRRRGRQTIQGGVFSQTLGQASSPQTEVATLGG